MSRKTVPMLRSEARALGIRGRSRMRKAELIEAIAAQSWPCRQVDLEEAIRAAAA